jgi:hypothetical protein
VRAGFFVLSLAEAAAAGTAGLVGADPWPYIALAVGFAMAAALWRPEVSK